MRTKSYYKDLFDRKTEDRFYVYVHYRESDGKPFYVGKGNAGRAWNRSSRNEYWKRVVNKHGLRVDIVFDHLTEDESFQVEKDTILEFKYFGYTLVNLTEGGDGPSGFKFSDEQKKRLSDARKGIPLTEAHKDVLSKALKYNYRDTGEYTFVNKNGEVFTGTKAELVKSYGLEYYQVQRIFIAGNTREWVLVNSGESPEDALKRVSRKGKGSTSNLAVKTIYTFVNKDSGEVFTGTRMELVEKFGVDRVSLSQVFNKANGSASTKGWGVLQENETVEDCLFRLKNKRTLSKSDPTVYKFIHKNGDSFIGTRVELCLKYGFDSTQIGALLSKTRKIKVCHGWSLSKE